MANVVIETTNCNSCHPVTVDDLKMSVGMSALPRMSDKLFQAMRHSDSIPRDHREEIFEAEFITRKEKRNRTATANKYVSRCVSRTGIEPPSNPC